MKYLFLLLFLFACLNGRGQKDTVCHWNPFLPGSCPAKMPEPSPLIGKAVDTPTCNCVAKAQAAFPTYGWALDSTAILDVRGGEHLPDNGWQYAYEKRAEPLKPKPEIKYVTKYVKKLVDRPLTDYRIRTMLFRNGRLVTTFNDPATGYNVVSRGGLENVEDDGVRYFYDSLFVEVIKKTK